MLEGKVRMKMKGRVIMYQRRSPLGWILGLVGLASVIAIGITLFFFFKPDGATTKELSFADALVTLNQERNHLVVTSADREETLLGEWSLPVYWMQSDRYGNGLYLIEKTSETEATIHELTLSPDLVDLKEKYRFTYTFTDETVITLDEDSLTLYEPSQKKFTYVNTEFFQTRSFEVLNQATPDAWYSTDETLYYSVGNDLFVYSWEHEELLSMMSFEDEIVDLFEKEQALYLFNQFGATSNYTTIFKLDPKTLTITDLGKVDVTELGVYPMSYVSNTTFFKGIDARSKKDVLAVFNPIEDLSKSEILTDAILEQSFIFTAHDYLYTLSEAGDVAIYAKHTDRPVYTLKGDYSEVYPLWYTTDLEEADTEEAELSY